jgi:hypothetical protein
MACFQKARPGVPDLKTGREVITLGTMPVDTIDGSCIEDYKDRKKK